MAIGDNVLKDRLIKKTTGKGSNTSKTSKASGGKTGPEPKRSTAQTLATYHTVKMTFYVKKELLERLYNFAYWDRYNVTEAFNTVLADGLKGKNTKPKPKQ